MGKGGYNHLNKGVNEMNNEIQKQESEIIAMRSPTGERHRQPSNNAWSPWALFGVIVAAIIVGNIAWWWGVSIYAQHKLGEAAELAAQEAKANEQKRREIFYKEAARHELERQSQKEENARIAWERYHAEQQRKEQQKQQDFILAQQRQWQNQGINTVQQGFSIPKDNAETQAESCKAWRNSQLIDPTPKKQKYIDENCS